MEHDFDYQEPRKLGSFFAAAGITLTIGVGLAVIMILHFKKPPAPPPEVIRNPPEVRTIREPAPPPEVIIKEVVREVGREAPALRPLPHVVNIPGRKPWEGIWRPRNAPLPMFRLKQARGTVIGVYAPVSGAVLQLRGGREVGNAVEVAVDDCQFRVHFRLTVIDSTSVSAAGFITDEDWLISLQRANWKVKMMPQQAFEVRRQLEEYIALKGKPVSIGVLHRGLEN